MRVKSVDEQALHGLDRIRNLWMGNGTARNCYAVMRDGEPFNKTGSLPQQKLRRQSLEMGMALSRRRRLLDNFSTQPNNLSGSNILAAGSDWLLGVRSFHVGQSYSELSTQAE